MRHLATNWFELLDHPPSFDIDLERLAQRFRALQLKYHPDRFSQASDEDKRMAMQATALLNAAYQGLKNPRLRARYLLEQAGVTLDDEQDTLSDSTFLMQQLILRESLEEALDSDDPLAALAALNQEIKAADHALQAAFAQAWQQQTLSEAKAIVLKMRFYERLLAEVREREERFEESL